MSLFVFVCTLFVTQAPDLQQDVIINQFKIIYGDKSFNWIPDIHHGDEKQWQENYLSLINKIETEYSINSQNIGLQHIQTGKNIEDGTKLQGIWNDFSGFIEIKVDEELKTKTDVNLSVKQEAAIQEYKKWFNDVLELPEYYDKFVNAGYKNLSFLDDEIDEDELINDIGIQNKVHRRRILKEIHKLVETRKLSTIPMGMNSKSDPTKQSTIVPAHLSQSDDEDNKEEKNNKEEEQEVKVLFFVFIFK